MKHQNETAASPFTDIESEALAGLAQLIIPASARHALPGADDPQILTTILADAARHRPALAEALAGFSAMKAARNAAAAEELAAAFRQAFTAAASLIQTVVVQCYYRDDRVMRSLSIELRPPFPTGYQIDQGDWSLLDPVRSRPPLYRTTD